MAPEPKSYKSLIPQERDALQESLALFERPEAQRRQQIFDADTDVDSFVDAALARARGNATLPPF